MPFQTSLLDDLRRFDVPVLEIAGWDTRGYRSGSSPTGGCTPKVGVNHHTAGSLNGNAPSLGIVINGRSDVPGPLANVLGGRDHVARLIAAGRSNNAGLGGWRGISGNINTLGLEMEHVGLSSREPVTDDDIEFMVRIQAAFAWKRYSAEYVCQHYEWAPLRKIDYVKDSVPTAYTPEGFRSRVAKYLEWGGVNPPDTGDDMTDVLAKLDAVLAEIDNTKPFAGRLSRDFTVPETGEKLHQGQVWVISPGGRFWVDRDGLNLLYFTHRIHRDENGQPNPIDPEAIASIPPLTNYLTV